MSNGATHASFFTALLSQKFWAGEHTNFTSGDPSTPSTKQSVSYCWSVLPAT